MASSYLRGRERVAQIAMVLRMIRFEPKCVPKASLRFLQFSLPSQGYGLLVDQVRLGASAGEQFSCSETPLLAEAWSFLPKLGPDCCVPA